MPFQKHAVPHRQKNAACLQFNVLREARPSAFKETRISDTPRDYTRSASHISGFFWKIWRFSVKAKYARLRTLPRVGCPSGACSSRRAPLPERPAAQGAATGLWLFQSAVRISPAVCDAGSIAHFRGSWLVIRGSCNSCWGRLGPRVGCGILCGVISAPLFSRLAEMLVTSGVRVSLITFLLPCYYPRRARLLPMWKCCQFQCCQLSMGRRECARLVARGRNGPFQKRSVKKEREDADVGDERPNDTSHAPPRNTFVRIRLPRASVRDNETSSILYTVCRILETRDRTVAC